MAIYFVASGGSNTAPYDTWAKAATSLATALAAATTPNDIVVIQYNAVPSADSAIGADTTYSAAANDVSIISASNDGGSAYTPTPMGTANWIGNSSATWGVGIGGNFRSYCYGLTLRVAGTGTKHIELLAGADQAQLEFDAGYLWLGTTSTSGQIRLGNATGAQQSYVKLKNTTMRLSHVAQTLGVRCMLDIEGGALSSDGSVPTNLIAPSTNAGFVKMFGTNLAHLGSSPVVGNNATAPMTVFLAQCALGANYELLATQTVANKSSVRVFAFDCAVGDVHGHMAYADPFGKMSTDTAIFFSSGAAGVSWKIVTTAAASFATPFESPWMTMYHDGVSAITPYLEILRDGSATAFDNDEVWAEFAAKVTSGSVLPTFYRDRMAFGGAPAAQDAGAGLGSWTGEGGTAWSGKCDSGGSLTPAEAGDISARICVGLPSATVYVDPQPRM